jgi:CHAT domain-containing protein/Tfp pilus assembly protein PilF
MLLPASGSVSPRRSPGTETSGGRTSADSPSLSTLRSHAATLFRSGLYAEAAQTYRHGYDEAMREGERGPAARFLNDTGAALLASFAYRDAMRAFLDARRLAERLGDRETSGVISLNLASLYLQMGDLSAATVEASRADDALKTVPGSAYRGAALVQLAKLKAREEGLEAAVPLFCAAARVVDAQGDIALKALVLNQLGFEYLNRGRLSEAERSMTEAYRLRLLSHDRDIGQSYRALGLLRLAQGDLESAEVLLDRALAAGNRHPGRVPNWAEYHARGQLRMAQGRLPDAVQDFRHALTLAKQWRLEVLPADSVRLSAGVGLAQLYSSFTRAAGELYMETRERTLAREAFSAAEEMRAAALRTPEGSGLNWRSRLPAEYVQTLRELRATRVKMERAPCRATRDEARRERERLTEMEAGAGAPESADDSGDLLREVSHALAPSEALISFHLDDPCSYAWIVTRRGFTFRRLAPAKQLRLAVRDFSEAVRSDGPETTALGERLYRELFPANGGNAESKRHWLIAADGALLDTPFSSLVVGQGQGRPVYLIETHSLTLLPTSRLLVRAGRASRGVAPGGPFLGVGDPIYNTADPRAPGRGDSTTPGQLPRLVASGVEIGACARAWRPLAAPVLLEGPAATRQRLGDALAEGPAVIHLAAHVIRSADDPPRQLIQLSLRRGGDPDYLGAEDIAAWRLRKAAIVVLSGCGSGRAEAPAPVLSTFAPPGADTLTDAALIGLARAWLDAGARAVVASHWATSDDTGDLFLSFYGHLRASGGTGVAQALAHAQIDMLESKSWRSAPRQWAAYFVIGRN